VIGGGRLSGPGSDSIGWMMYGPLGSIVGITGGRWAGMTN